MKKSEKDSKVKFYQPKNKDELLKLLDQLIKERGYD